MFGRGSALYLFHLAYLSTYFQVTAVPFHKADENCVISFVVPKEKMKSSCELDEKVNRRINSVETKVNIYKQQVSDIQVQSDKQRQLHADKMTKMEELVRDISGNMDMSFLIERRLALLEKEFQQLQSDVSSVKSTSAKTKPAPAEDKPVSLFFNTVDNSHTLSGLAKSMIQSEIKMFMDNYTKRLEGYVQEQVLVYNRVFNMLPKRTEETTQNERPSESSSVPPIEEVNNEIIIEEEVEEGDKVEVVEHKQDDRLNMTEEEFDRKVISYLENTTNEENVDKFNDESINITDVEFNSTDEYFNATAENFTATAENFNATAENFNATDEVEIVNSTITLEDYKDTIDLDNSTIINIDDLVKYNHSVIEDVSEDNKTSQTFVVKHVDDEISKSATSRIHSKSETMDNSKDQTDVATGKVKTDVDSDYDKNWNEFMVRDQDFHKQLDIDGRIKEEVTSMLLPPLARVMSLMEEQKKTLEDKITLQDKRCEKINEDLTKHVKSLDSSVHTITLRMDSLSKELKDTTQTKDKLKLLESRVSELQKNITTEAIPMSALDIDEQSKRLKKLERLMGVYQQSMDRYRNETKHEFRDMKDSLEKETTAVRVISKTVQSDLTSTINSQINKQNSSFMNKILEINEQLKLQDQNLLLLQLDLANVEKAVSGRASRFSDRDVDKLQDEVSTLTSRHRELKKKFDNLDHSQTNLAESLNATSSEVSALKMEVRLSLDQWVPLSFEYDTSKTDCYGDQFAKRSHFSKSLLVGVVLCSPVRYKIFLSSSLHGKFLNIGDGNGVGEDHCEFVGAANGAEVKLSQLKPTFGSVQGYARNNWGEKPFISYLNVIKPSPHWYECGVEIP